MARNLHLAFAMCFVLFASTAAQASTPASTEPADGGTQPDSSDGSGAWSIVESPNAPTAEPIGTFNGIACVSASDCWAVGYGNNGSAYQTMIQHWDGASWTIVPSANTSEVRFNVLNDVSCVSASECWAVGYSSTGSTYETLVHRWDGTSWRMVDSPNASATDVLSDVTCISASDCWAVGYTYSSLAGAAQTLIERWNGTSWAIVTSPNTGATQGNSLSGVACATATDCWAVGTSAGGTLIERWNGTSWTIVASPNRSGYANGLSSVTCAGASGCWAVGASSNGNDWRTLIERWDGTSWTIVASPNKSALQMNNLADVTCLSAAECWAIGGYYPGTTWQTMTQRWDGASWSVVSSPSVPGVQNFLSAMACPHGSSCLAVGSAWTATAKTLAQRWDGASWGMVDSPNTTGHSTNVLDAVTCVSASDCWAVGHYYPNPYGAARTLIERWDGTSWTIVTSPNAGARRNQLSDVACVSAEDCWAVGSHDTDSAIQTLVMRWRRWDEDSPPSWGLVASANTASSLNNSLSGVTCASASDCWAVGSHFAGSPSRTLIEHWDGTEWALVASPNPGSPDPGARQRNELLDVTCISASDCWAVGSYDADAPTQTVSTRPKTSRTLTAHWDGTSWNVAPSPDTLAVEQHVLSDVTCVSASDCWAVGHSYNGIIAQTFVGQVDAGGTARQTLIKRWDGSKWAAIASPSAGPTSNSVLTGVTCASASGCWAVGSQDVEGVAQTLIQRWEGSSWVTVASPSTSGGEPNLLSGVTCVSSSGCWAVGSSHNGVVARTLTARYADAS